MIEDIRVIIGDWLLRVALVIYPDGDIKTSLCLAIYEHLKRQVLK